MVHSVSSSHGPRGKMLLNFHLISIAFTFFFFSPGVGIIIFENAVVYTVCSLISFLLPEGSESRVWSLSFNVSLPTGLSWGAHSGSPRPKGEHVWEGSGEASSVVLDSK